MPAKRFKAKIIRVGTSAGIIIPKEILKEKGLQAGEKAYFSIVITETERHALIEKMWGSMPDLGPFVRDKSDRMERLYGNTRIKGKKHIKQVSK